MRILKITTLTFLLLLILPLYNYSQSKALQKLVDSPKKIEKALSANSAMRNEIKNYQIKKGYCTEADYKLPKKIGILTFYVKDQEHQIYSTSYGSSWKYTSKTTVGLTKDGANVIANDIYYNSIDDIKATYKNAGIDLLEPHEYLDTQEKKELYNNYEIKGSKFQKMFNKKFAKEKGSSAVASGYRMFDLNHTGLTMGKFIKSRDELLTKLDLDAYLVISLDFSIGRNALMAVTSNLIYKSPTAGLGKGKNWGGDFPDNATATIKQGNIWAKKVTYGDIIVIEKIEYTNKKGKLKKKRVATGIDKNVYFVTKAVANKSLQSLVYWINRKK